LLFPSVPDISKIARRFGGYSQFITMSYDERAFVELDAWIKKEELNCGNEKSDSVRRWALSAIQAWVRGVYDEKSTIERQEAQEKRRALLMMNEWDCMVSEWGTVGLDLCHK